MADESKRATIVIVDDERGILTALEDLLEQEFHVIVETSPAEALALIAGKQTIDVVISDQRMPTMTGDAFLARVREVSDAETILLTGYADQTAVVQAVNKGHIFGYLTKPWDEVALRAMVVAACERHTLLRALTTERALLHGLLDHTLDAVSFKDAEGRFVRLNEVKRRALGAADAAACLGRREAEIAGAAWTAEQARAETAAIAAARPLDSIEERVFPGRPTTFLAVSRIPILGRLTRELDYLVVIEHDITERRLIEDRMRQAEKMQAIGQLTGGVAHDFNNLLTAILGGLELLGGQVKTEQGQKLLQGAIRAAQRGANLVSQLMAFSRKQHLEPRATDLNALVAGMGEMLERTLGATIHIESVLAPDLWPALVDPTQIELAILNLAINGRDAMEQKGTLVVTTRNRTIPPGARPEAPAGDFVSIAVSDTGSGIPPEILARIFEPFFTTKEIGKGSGLGLSMVQGLVQQLGGAIHIDTAPGKGTTVEILLPRSSQGAAQAEAEASPTAPRTAGAERRLLVIDDDDDVRELTVGFLQDCGYRVFEAEDGERGLALLAREPSIELVLVDFAMPGLNGAEITRRIRERLPDLRIILMTGYSDPPIGDGIPIIRKPFSLADLADKVQIELFRKTE